MGFKNAAKFDTLRSVAFGSITTSYVIVGAELPSCAVCVAFTNNTNGIIYVSTDGINDMLAIPGFTGKVFDIRTNAPVKSNTLYPEGTQFYAKEGTTTPSSGNFYIEVLTVVIGV